MSEFNALSEGLLHDLKKELGVHEKAKESQAWKDLFQILRQHAMFGRSNEESVLSPVTESSQMFSHVQYHPVDEVLDVTFRSSGQKVRYEGVPAESYVGLVKSESMGAFFNKNIRGRHAHRSLSDSNVIAFES